MSGHCLRVLVPASSFVIVLTALPRLPCLASPRAATIYPKNTQWNALFTRRPVSGAFLACASPGLSLNHCASWLVAEVFWGYEDPVLAYLHKAMPTKVTSSFFAGLLGNTTSQDEAYLSTSFNQIYTGEGTTACECCLWRAWRGMWHGILACLRWAVCGAAVPPCGLAWLAGSMCPSLTRCLLIWCAQRALLCPSVQTTWRRCAATSSSR